MKSESVIKMCIGGIVIVISAMLAAMISYDFGRAAGQDQGIVTAITNIDELNDVNEIDIAIAAKLTEFKIRINKRGR